MEPRHHEGLAIMRVIHRALISGACVSVCLMMSCRKAQVATAPAAPPPAPIVVPRKEAPKKDVNLPAAPPIASKTTPTAGPPVDEKPPVLQPPAAPKPRRVRLARRSPALTPAIVVPKPAADEPKVAAEAKPEAAAAPKEAAPPTPEATAAPAPAAIAPKLGQLLKPEESRDYVKKLDTTVDRVRTAITAIQVKPLSEEQKEVVGRIRSFLAQAEQAREQDLVNAVNLAERADLLSRDLLERLR